MITLSLERCLTAFKPFSPQQFSRNALNCVSVRLGIVFTPVCSPRTCYKTDKTVARIQGIVFTLNGSSRTCNKTDKTQFKLLFGLNYAHFYRSCFTFLRINVIIFNGT